MALQPRDAAVEVLIATNVTELHRATGGGGRTIDLVYAACVTSGLAQAGLTSTEQRYIAVFDAALDVRLGCWVIDYVEMVCGDSRLTSNDPLEAYLLDGQFVKAWAARSLDATDAEMHALLTTGDQVGTGLGCATAPGRLLAGLSRCHALVAVLQALDRLRSAGSGGAEEAATMPELRQALRLQSGMQALAWCVRRGLHTKLNTGRHATCIEWTARVAARRDASSAQRTRASEAAPAGQGNGNGNGSSSADSGLFIDSMLDSLKMHGSYPFASLSSIMFTLYVVSKDVSEVAVAGKLSVLLYCLMDLGWVASDADMEDFRRSFHVPSAAVVQWRCQFLLDCAQEEANAGEADIDDEGSAVNQASQLLLGSVQPDTPFRFVEVLLALGRPDAALALHRARAAPGTLAGHPAAQSAVPRTLHEASVLLELRLRCRLLTEAFTEMRAHCTTLPLPSASQSDSGPSAMADDGDAAAAAARPSPRAEHVEALVTQLADWALHSSSSPGGGGDGGFDDSGSSSEPWMQRLLELPFSAEEEAVLVRWLLRQAEAGEAVGDHLTLYFLARGRTPEALGAWNRVKDLPTASAEAATRREAVSTLMDGAFQLQPEPLRNFSIEADPQAAALLYGPIGLLAGVEAAVDGVAVMHTTFLSGGAAPPPFVTSRMPAPFTSPPSVTAAAGAALPPATAARLSAAGVSGTATARQSSGNGAAAVPSNGGGGGSSAPPPVLFGVPSSMLTGGTGGTVLGAMPGFAAPSAAYTQHVAPPQSTLRDQIFGLPAARGGAVGGRSSAGGLFGIPSALPPSVAATPVRPEQAFGGRGGAVPASLFAGLTAADAAAAAGGGGEPNSASKRPRTQSWIMG